MIGKKRISGFSNLGDVRSTLQYHLSPREQRVSPSVELPFGLQGSQCFRELVAESDTYLEYGAGASTLAAYEMHRQIVTVESDKHFLKAVKSACSSRGQDSEHNRSHFIHADIGPTGTWGKPLFPSIPRTTKWKSYAFAPWAMLGSHFRADVILIDGRFRVACALTVALQQHDSQWLLMFDDYLERKEYWQTEEFLRLKERCGRMAVFEPQLGVDRAAALTALEHYSRDWR